MAGRAGARGADFVVGEGPDGVRVRVHVRPGARADRVQAPDPWRGAAVVQVAAQAEGGKANARLIGVLADALGVAPADVVIEHGHTSRDKVVVARGVTAEAVRRALGGAP